MVPTQEHWEESDYGKQEIERLKELEKRLFPPMGIFADPVIKDSEDNCRRQAEWIGNLKSEKLK